MSGVPRSQRLLSFNAAAPGAQASFVVPTGYVALVKSAYWQNNNASAAVLIQLFHTMADVGAYGILDKGSVAANSLHTWQGWAVVHPGETLLMYCDTANVEGGCYGALLAGPPQFPPGH